MTKGGVPLTLREIRHATAPNDRLLIVVDGDNWLQPFRNALAHDRLPELKNYLSMGRAIVGFDVFLTNYHDRDQFYAGNGYASRIAESGITLNLIEPRPNGKCVKGQAILKGYEDEIIFRHIRTRTNDFDSACVITNDKDFLVVALEVQAFSGKRIELGTATSLVVKDEFRDFFDRVHYLDHFLNK